MPLHRNFSLGAAPPHTEETSSDGAGASAAIARFGLKLDIAGVSGILRGKLGKIFLISALLKLEKGS
jgi:hypothetical protein